MTSKRYGAILSYISTICNSLVSIFLTPFILKSLGDAEYGIYRSVESLAGQLALISIGIGTISAVYIARFNARNDREVEKERENFLAFAITISLIIAILALSASGILYLTLDKLYAKTLSPEQIILVKKLFVLFAVNVALYLFRDVFVGIIHGYEQFIYSNGTKLLRILLRVILIIVLLECGYSAIGLALCDVILTSTLILCDIIYCKIKLKLKIRFHCFDKKLFFSILTFSLAVFLQTIVNQVNQNLDGVILGAMIPPERVATYSLALTIYVAYNSLSSSIASLFTPEAARLVQRKESQETLMNYTIRVGRYQFIIAAMVMGGFIVVGKNFVALWAGTDKMDVYFIALILMLPMSIANVLSGANSILDGYMKRMGRSIILIVTAAINIGLSIALIKYVDYWGAAVGTAFSVLLGQIFILSMYYKKIFGFSLLKFVKGIMKGILLSVLIAICVSVPFEFLNLNNYLLFVIKGSAFVATYCLCLYYRGANTTEKNIINELFKKKWVNRKKQ